MESGPTDPAAKSGTSEALRGPWWWSGRRHLADDQRNSVLKQVFFEGEDFPPFISRFTAMMTMAVLIAGFGLVRDSGPVVIGAMLISPLTTPLMALCTSLVLGQPWRQLRASGVLVAASLGGVGLGALMMFLIPESSSVALDSEELIARTNPALLDLAVAIVAGAAGAYVLVRREAIAALPGVAIAVALVPPLTTVGITSSWAAPTLPTMPCCST